MQQMLLRLEEVLPGFQESLFGVHKIVDVREPDSLERLQKWLGDEELVAFDLETLSPKGADINTPSHADLAQVIICTLAHPKGAMVLTCPYQDSLQQSDKYWREAFQLLRDLVFIVHNSSYDMQFVHRIAGYIPERIVDTMVLYGLVTPGREVNRIDSSQSLASAVSIMLGYRMDKSIRETFDIEKFQFITAEQCRYAAEDAQWTLYLASALVRQIERDAISHIAELECRLTPVLIRMKLMGVLVDIDIVQGYANRVDRIQQQLEERLYSNMERDHIAVMAFLNDERLTLSELVKMYRSGKGEVIVDALPRPLMKDKAVRHSGVKPRTVSEIINIRSPHFWQEYLRFISGGRITSSQSRNIETFSGGLRLGKVASAYPPEYNQMIIDLLETLIDYRAVSKINSTYLKSWQNLHRGGRVHTTFVQTYAESGRLSSRHPNLQNCPRPDTTQFLEKYLGEPLDMRSMFVAPPGMVLITADYSQYELRVAAERAEEYKMIEVYQHEYEARMKLEALLREYGYYPWDHVELEDERYEQIQHELGLLDFHRRNAARIFNKSPEEVTKMERTQAKAISFGVLYGMQAPSLAETINRLTGSEMTIEEAQRLLDAYFDTYRQLKRYIDMTIYNAYRHRYVTSILGRKRWCALPTSIPRNGVRSLIRSFAANVEREAVNHTIQSTNADATKLALVLLDQELRARGYDINTTYPVLTVHDEIVVQSPQECANEVAMLLRDCMVEGSRQAGLVTVPTVVEVAIGPSWCK